MNREKLTELRDFLRTPEARDHFNMEDYFIFPNNDLNLNACGSASCVAGWVILLDMSKNPFKNVSAGDLAPLFENYKIYDFHNKARDILNLDNYMADGLFSERESVINDTSADALTAAHCIDILLEKGYVNWREAHERRQLI